MEEGASAEGPCWKHNGDTINAVSILSLPKVIKGSHINKDST